MYIFVRVYICIFVAMQFRNHNRATQSSLRYYATSCHSNASGVSHMQNTLNLWRKIKNRE